MKRIIYLLSLIVIFGCQDKSIDLKIFADQDSLDELSFAIEKLGDQLAAREGRISLTANKQDADLRLELIPQADTDSEKNDEGKGQAIQYLEVSKTYWQNMVELAEKYNVDVMPHQFDNEFSWRKHLENVDKDIATARETEKE